MKPRLKETYTKTVVPALQAKFGYRNVMQIPKITKICLNQGVGEAVSDKKLVDQAVEEMSTIAGQ
jgi:large subunit ribosomal protein L5